jgi:DNA polymerase III alpha subunit
MLAKYECGCSFRISDSEDRNKIIYDTNDINFDCVKTWDLLADGNTKGVFQLESRLGQSMSKKLKPENIEVL